MKNEKDWKKNCGEAILSTIAEIFWRLTLVSKLPVYSGVHPSINSFFHSIPLMISPFYVWHNFGYCYFIPTRKPTHTFFHEYDNYVFIYIKVFQQLCTHTRCSLFHIDSISNHRVLHTYKCYVCIHHTITYI